MDKLKLDLDDLEVESFSAGSEEETEEGTVEGNLPYTWQDLPECISAGPDCTEPGACTFPADQCPA